MKLSELSGYNKWPKAFEDAFIVNKNDEYQKLNRAKSIVDLFLPEQIKGLKILDFGCGEGHVSKVMADNGAIVTAYDPVDTFKFKDQVEFKSDKISGNYDIVLAFDVFDHCVKEKPEDMLSLCASMITSGKIITRMHPWCSRHGTHHFHEDNRAFIHMICDDLPEAFPTVKIIHPLNTYNKWIKHAGLIIHQKEVQRESVEPFFFKNFKDVINSHYRESPIDENLRQGKGWAGYALEQCFHDYVLIK